MVKKRTARPPNVGRGVKKIRPTTVNHVRTPGARNGVSGAPPAGLEQLAEGLLAVLFDEFEKLKQESFTIVDKGRVRANPRIRGFVQLFTALRPYAKLLSKRGEELVGILDAAVARWSEQSG